VVALFALLAEIIIYLANLASPPHVVGQNIFLGLSIVCMGYCALAGRISTADCLSEEKREGTLGLLFLTDLKGYDIVLGKLVSTSLGGLYCLLAVMPVLALPLLLGGVTSGEFWRVVLVLVNTFFFSLAIGLFGSAISRDAQRAMAANFALIVLLMAALPLGLFYFSHLRPPNNLMSSPLYSFYLSQDIRFKANPAGFRGSVEIVAAQTVFLLVAASLIAPGTWQDKPGAPRRAARISWSGFWRALSYGKYAKLAPYRKRLLDHNAFYWLAARPRLNPLHVWLFLGLMAFWWVLGWTNAGMLWFDEATAVTLAVILNCTLKAWIALEGGRQLAEDQKAGALELLLVTPLTVRDILRGQFLALRRQFLMPLLSTIVVELILMTTVLRHMGNREFEFHVWLAGIIMLAADVLTLPVVAMRVALTAKNPTRATLGTVWRVLGLPWFFLAAGVGVNIIWIELLSPFFRGFDYPARSVYLGLWFWGGIGVDAFFGLWAWRQLNGRFRELATGRHAPQPARARRKAPLPARLPKRKTAILAGPAVVLLAVYAFWVSRKAKPDYPPPLEVSITQSNAPLRVFPGLPSFMILPDGSLWRWGAMGNPGVTQTSIAAPERVSTNDDWVQVIGAGLNSLGLRKDGTLWKWSLRQPSIVPVDSAHDWARFGVGDRLFMAIKRDGTLWAWGDNYANPLVRGPGPNSESPVQIGSEAGWADVLCQYNCTLALRTNGTLWIWGQTWSQQTGSVTFPTPTLVCSETNWTGLGSGFGMWPWARNASGEIWQFTPALADPTVSLSAIGQLTASNSAPNQLVSGYVGKPELFEVRGDGTLWEQAFSLPPRFIVAPSEPWRQVGTRSDWQKVWASNNTVFGLTADGTLWTWGLDPSRNGKWTFSMKVRLVEERLKEIFSSSFRSRAGYGSPMAIQETPRPLLHLNYGR
jgi:ABC-type transport system involved in multi-copper enzyme maturation permease subunit